MLFSRHAQGYAAVLAGVLLSLVNGILYSWSVFILPIENATGLTRPQTSLVFTFILVFFGLGMMTGGYVLKRVGSRLTAALGGAMLALGLAGAAMATAQWQLVLFYGVIAGYGIGMANIVPSAVGLRWFPHRRGLVCGVMAFSLASGTLVLGAGLAGRLIPAVGVSHTLLIMALLALGISAPASFFLKAPEKLPGTAAHGNALSGMDTGEMLRTFSFRLVWIWAFSIQAGGLMIIGHIVPYALEQGCSQAAAELAMGVYAVVNGVGRLLFGQLFDMKGAYLLHPPQRLPQGRGQLLQLFDMKGARFVMLVNSLFMAAGLVMLAVLPGTGYAGFIFSVIVIALAAGGTIPQFSAFIARNFGPAHLETNIGMTATVFIVAGFAGPYAGGWIQNASGAYQAAIFTAALLGLPGFIAAMRLPEGTEKA